MVSIRCPTLEHSCSVYGTTGRIGATIGVSATISCQVFHYSQVATYVNIGVSILLLALLRYYWRFSYNCCDVCGVKVVVTILLLPSPTALVVVTLVTTGVTIMLLL